ncbi:MAG: hypothetical protein FJ091_18585 [Deltaproteobacteria bacterium]|nr:hypothetical protein [Deltaproteobacteria bacterium]
MEKLLKGLAITLGASLILGETLRSWGQGRPLPFVLDDYLIGGGLIAGALWFRADDLRRRAAFAAAWAATMGGLYGSFFGKLLEPGGDFHTNIPGGLLTALIGVAYATSIFGMIATIALKPRG